MQTTNVFQPMWLEVDGWILGERIPVCQELSKSLGKGFDLSFFHCCVLSLLFCSTIWHRIIQLWKTVENHSQAIQSKWRWRLVVWARVVWIEALPGAQLWFETLVTASHSGCVYVDRFLEAVWLEKRIKIYQLIHQRGRKACPAGKTEVNPDARQFFHTSLPSKPSKGEASSKNSKLWCCLRYFARRNLWSFILWPEPEDEWEASNIMKVEFRTAQTCTNHVPYQH